MHTSACKVHDNLEFLSIFIIFKLEFLPSFLSIYNSITLSDSCLYHYGASSKPCFSHTPQWIYLHTLSWLMHFGPVSYIHQQYVILSRFLLYTFCIGVTQKSYLYQTSHSSLSKLSLEHYKLKPQWILLTKFLNFLRTNVTIFWEYIFEISMWISEGF